MKIAIKIYIIAGGLLIIPLMIKAQTLCLSDILDSIQLNNPGLQQFAWETKGNLEMSESVSAWPAPKIGIGLSEFPYGSGLDKMMARKMPMLQIQQMFPNFSKQRTEVKYYQSLSLQNKDKMRIMKNLLFARAKTAYYDAVIAQKKESVINEQKKQLQLLMKIVSGRLAYNKADLPTIYNMQSRMSDIHSNEIKIENAFKIAVTELNTLMNKSPNTSLKIDTAVIGEIQDELTFPLDSFYVTNHRSDIQLINHKIESKKWKQEAISKRAKPTFGITWDNMAMPGNRYMYSLMATASIPIAPWSSKRYQSKKKAIDYQIQATQKKKKNRTIEVIGSIYKSQLAWKAQQQELKLFKTEVLPAYKKTYQARMSAFGENEGDIYKTLMAWSNFINKRMLYLDKLKKLFHLKVNLEKELEQYK